MELSQATSIAAVAISFSSLVFVVYSWRQGRAEGEITKFRADVREQNAKNVKAFEDLYVFIRAFENDSREQYVRKDLFTLNQTDVKDMLIRIEGELSEVNKHLRITSSRGR